MTPKVIALLVAIVLIIVVGMVLTVKRATERNAARELDVTAPAKPATR